MRALKGTSRDSAKLSRRGVLQILAILGLPAIAPEFGFTAANAQEKKTIAVSFPNSSKIGAVIVTLEQAKQKANELGYDLIIDDPGSDMNKQINTIKTWIEQKVAVIVAQGANPNALEVLGKQAKDNGIHWITYGDRLKNQDATVGYQQYNDGRKLGEYAGQWITDNLGGKAEVAILGFAPMVWGQQRGQGIEEGLLAKAPNVTIVAKQNAITPVEGLDVTRSLLQAHPDLNVILGVEDPATEGAYKAWVASGRDPKRKDAFIGGMDGTVVALRLLKEGDNVYRASVAIPLKAVGDAIAETAHTLVARGISPDNIVPLELITPGSPLAEQYLEEQGDA